MVAYARGLTCRRALTDPGAPAGKHRGCGLLVTTHRFHGDERRFEATADFVAARFPQARSAADVAGGQGMLARILRKRHNIDCDVVDPRGWVLRGVSSRAEDYRADMASYYDVVIGLHPDNALPEVVNSAQVRPVVVVPCCNFWSQGTRLGREQLLDAIEKHHARYGTSERAILSFRGPHNRALVLLPEAFRNHEETAAAVEGRLDGSAAG